MGETTLLKRISLILGRRTDTRIFRNNVGVLKNEHGQRVAYGLCPGSSDLIGIRKVVITPEMVGRTMGQFVALEIKYGRTRPTRKQELFMAMVQRFGGLTGVARSEEDAIKIIEHDK